MKKITQAAGQEWGVARFDEWEPVSGTARHGEFPFSQAISKRMMQCSKQELLFQLPFLLPCIGACHGPRPCSLARICLAVRSRLKQSLA